MSRFRTLLILLLVATLLVDAAACHFAQGQRFPAPAMLLLVALALSQTGLLAIWLTLGTAHYLLRTAVLIAGIVVWARAIAWIVPSLAFGGPLALEAAVTALFAIPIRWRGVVWSWSTDRGGTSSGARTGRVQFTVSRMLGWTTVAAIVVVLLRHFVTFPPPGQRFESGIVLVTWSVAVLGGAYVGSTSRHAVAKLALTIVLVALLIWSVIPVQHRVGPYVTLCVLETLFALVWVTASRATGLTIHRVETSVGQSNSTPAPL